MGPGAEEEAFLASEDVREDNGNYGSSPERTPEPARPLTGVEELASRIPVETRKSLEDLLRARFTKVRRLREGELR